MITINLLPEELRIVEKKKTSGNQYLRIGILLGIIFVGVTAYFYSDFLITSAKLNSAKSEWSSKQPEYQSLNALRSEVEGVLKTEKDFMENFVTTHQPLTTILVWVSEFLPDYAWLEELTMRREQGEGKLLLRGIAYSSAEKSSIAQIEEYLQALKGKLPESTLSLTTTRVEYVGVMLTQFYATYTWEDREVYEQIA